MNKPNLFLVGAPKCGTTSLHYYLNQHPDIYMCEPKEPNFFNTDLKRKSRYSKEEYYALFKGRREKILGEATPLYLMSKTAPIEIKSASPNAKIVIAIRRPAELIYSAFYQNRYNVIEEEEDILHALSAEEYRRKNLTSTITGEPVERLIYSNFVSFTEQIGRYFDCFGKSNTHILLFDDLKKDTPMEVKKILSFLNLDSKVSLNYTIQNAGKSYKNKTLARFLYSPSGVIKKVSSILPVSLKQSIYQRVKNLNTDNKRPPKLSLSIDQIITDKYQDEIERLETLINRDLSNWKKVPNT